MVASIDFYASPGPLTDLAEVDPTLLTSLPTGAAELCEVSACLGLLPAA